MGGAWLYFRNFGEFPLDYTQLHFRRRYWVTRRHRQKNIRYHDRIKLSL